MEDDDLAANRVDYKIDRWNDKRHGGSFEKNKKEEKIDDRKLGIKAFKGVNTIFNRPIHKIMYEIQSQPFFKWPKPMEVTQALEIQKFDASTIRIMDTKHRITKLWNSSWRGW